MHVKYIWDKVNLIWSIWSPLLHFFSSLGPLKSLHKSTQFWCTLSNCVTWEFKALFVNVESGVKRGRNCKWLCYRLFSLPLQSLNGGIFCPQQIRKVWRGQLYNFLCSLKMIAIFSEVGMESCIVRTINHDLVMIVDKMSLVWRNLCLCSLQ